MTTAFLLIITVLAGDSQRAFVPVPIKTLEACRNMGTAMVNMLVDQSPGSPKGSIWYRCVEVRGRYFFEPSTLEDEKEGEKRN